MLKGFPLPFLRGLPGKATTLELGPGRLFLLIRCFVFFWVTGCFLHGGTALANVPGGIVAGTNPNVTVTTASSGGVVTGGTMSNGVVAIQFTVNGAELNQINYTYNNGSGVQTKKMLLNGKDGGEFYWEFGGLGSGGAWTYALAADPSTNGGNYAEIVLTCNASGTSANGDLQVNFSMLRGSPGFYVTLTMNHHAGDLGTSLGEMRTNIYTAPDLNWNSVNGVLQRLAGINATFTPAYDSTQEDSLCITGIGAGTYDDKYKYSADWGQQRVWGLSSVQDPTLTSATDPWANVGIWYVLASSEYYNGGPLKPELMDAPLVNMLNGGHYQMGSDSNWATDEDWHRVQGPFFVYFNNIPPSVTDPVQASQQLYGDAVAQGAAEATAWPYTWYNNATYDNYYMQASQRGTVTGQMAISDPYNPNASAANLWVGVVAQPSSTGGVYDFQQWYKSYQFWTKTDANGNFTIPNVIATANIPLSSGSSSNTTYTLYAFGQGGAGTFMSQAQNGGNPPWAFNVAATPFSVNVAAGGTTSLGTVTWTPQRKAPTVFEIGYPDRTARKFRHGDDFWVGDVGPNAATPSPIWTKFFDFPNDFPNGPNYVVGTNKWPTDWNFIQPIAVNNTGGYNSTSASISFDLPSAPVSTSTAALYVAIAADDSGAVNIAVNGTNLGGHSGVTSTPSSFPSTGYLPSYTTSDSSIREQPNGSSSDDWIQFPASLLKSGSNSIVFSLRQAGGSYFADNFMYDYIRLELPGYFPPAPSSVAGYPGNNCALLSWPTTPGAVSYNVLRTTTPGSNYSAIASGTTAATGPSCGSGPANATYLDTTATNGSTYYYVVQSANTVGASANSSQSNSVAPSTVAGNAAPAVPTGVGTSGSAGGITLTWSPVSGANYYTVQRSTLWDRIPQWTVPATLSATESVLSTVTLSNTVTGSSYTDNAVTNGTKYAYYVQASNAAGTSGTSVAVIGKAAPIGGPASPSIKASPGAGSVTLTWPAVAGATGYVIAEGTASGGPYTYISSINALTYTITGLSNATPYYFVVSAMNAGGSGSSPEVSATTPLAAPANLTAVAGNTQVQLNWTSVPGATGYTISRGTATGGPYTAVGTSTGPSYVDGGLTNGTTYYYVVVTTNANGPGINSAEVNATPSSGVPVAPLNLAATPGPRQVTLNWSVSSGAVSYTLYRGAASGGPYSAVASGITATTYLNTNLLDGVTYHYVVVAVNSTGPSANSADVAGTTLSGSTIPLTWDNKGASPGLPADGSGNWDTSSLLWSTAGADQAWSNSADAVAIIGNANGAAGTITAGNITTDGLVFNPAGSGAYTLTGGTLTISGSLSTITANANVTISSILANTGTTTINGNGTISFSNPATLSSTVNIVGTTLDLAGPSYSAAMLGTATLNLDGGTIVNITGGNNASEFSNSIAVAAGNSGTIIFSSRNGWGASATNPAITGAGTLNVVVASTLGGSRDDVYADFSSFGGDVNITGNLANAGMRYFLGTNVTGGANAIWNFGGAGTTVIFMPQSGGSNIVNLGGLTGGTNATLNGGSAGAVTYAIGAAGLNTSFAGVITGAAAVNKLGTGTQILSGNYSYTGSTTVTAGVLEFTGTAAGSSALSVSSGATLYLAGGSLSVSGAITNNGLFKISGLPALVSSGGFVNNGVLDLINGTGSLPSGFVNHGTVIDSSKVALRQPVILNGTFSATTNSYVQHTYQLQKAASLTAPINWVNTGASQPGTGQALTFSDSSGAGGAGGFYRVQVSP